MIKNKNFKRMIGGIGIVTPVAATITACATPAPVPVPVENANIEEATKILNDLNWEFDGRFIKLEPNTFNRDWFLSREVGHPLEMMTLAPNIDITIPQDKLILNPSSGIVKVTYQLSDGSKSLTSDVKQFRGWRNSLPFNTYNENIPKDLSNSVFKNTDLSTIKNWNPNLAGIDWTGAVGITSENTPFRGDLSNVVINKSILNGVDVSEVTTWPEDLSQIDWTGVIGLTPENTPFKGDITTANITNSKLNGVDVSAVTNEKWPSNLSDIDWNGVIGLTTTNTPFKDDISESTPEKPNTNSKTITGSILNGVDVGGVTKWPNDLTSINWTGIIGLSESKGNPFAATETLSTYTISGVEKDKSKMTHLNGVDVSAVTAWPETLTAIDWTGVTRLTTTNTPFKGNISNLNITYSNLNGVDVSQVETWPTNLSGINWTAIKNLKENTPFQINISNLDISDNVLKDVNVSKVQTWPTNLTGINWEGVLEINPDYTPFRENIASYTINGNWWSIEEGDEKYEQRDSKLFMSNFAGVDVSAVTTWPTNLANIDWRNIKNLGNNTPFKDDISGSFIWNAYLDGIDVTAVKIWPDDLKLINWKGVKGLTTANTPFKGDLSTFSMKANILEGVDVSNIEKWPTDLSWIDWTGVIGLTTENTPFQADISNLTLSNSIFEKINLSGVDKWPISLSGINWENSVLDLEIIL